VRSLLNGAHSHEDCTNISLISCGTMAQSVPVWRNINWHQKTGKKKKTSANIGTQNPEKSCPRCFFLCKGINYCVDNSLKISVIYIKLRRICWSMSIDGSAASNFFVVFKKVNCIYIYFYLIRWSWIPDHKQKAFKHESEF